MDELFTLTILYTYSIGGRFETLPRLATIIRLEQAAAPGPVLLLDGGNLCAREAWPCWVTHGRAGLSVLEAMGYDAAVLNDEELSFTRQVPGPAGRRIAESFARQTTMMPLLSRALSDVPGIEKDLIFERGDLAFGVTVGDVSPRPPIRPGSLLSRISRSDPNPVLREEADLIIALDFHGAARPGLPFLRSSAADIVLRPDEAQNRRDPPALLVAPYHIDPSLTVHEQDRRVIPCTDDIPPDPTISAVLELVMDEAKRLRVKAGLDKDAPPPGPRPAPPGDLPDWLKSSEL